MGWWLGGSWTGRCDKMSFPARAGCIQQHIKPYHCQTSPPFGFNSNCERPTFKLCDNGGKLPFKSMCFPMYSYAYKRWSSPHSRRYHVIATIRVSLSPSYHASLWQRAKKSTSTDVTCLIAPTCSQHFIWYNLAQQPNSYASPPSMVAGMAKQTWHSNLLDIFMPSVVAKSALTFQSQRVIFHWSCLAGGGLLIHVHTSLCSLANLSVWSKSNIYIDKRYLSDSILNCK